MDKIKKQILHYGFLFITVIFVGSLFSCSQNRINTALFRVETNKACYKPGEMVEFTVHGPGKNPLQVNYYFEAHLIESQLIKADEKSTYTWTWQPPDADFSGYLVEVIPADGSRRATIGIDVSSDWSLYPRYGFISKFPKMTNKQINAVIRKLNRYHINGLQFYDWHNTHHNPLKGSPEHPAAVWIDIAKRKIHRTTVKSYIKTAHQYNMMTMAYNLLYGAWSSGFQEGVKPEWGLYKDRQKREPFYLNMPDGWADDIYFMNPGNQSWKDYLFKNMENVFLAFDFDGWHIDQIGDIDTLYTYDGMPLLIKDSFRPFITEAKIKLGKRLVMNAVAQYGWEEIATSPVDFFYNEVWNPDSTFNDLVKILDAYRSVSGKYNTVLPAYMDYANSSSPGMFNTPGILFADAVIFANGGAHLELGEHMLCHEYFPNDNLKMSQELEKTLVTYYDFSVAYQTLLRNPKLEKINLPVVMDNFQTSGIAEAGKVWTISKTIDNKIIIHLINLTQMKDINWRDTHGTRKEPEPLESVNISIPILEKIKSVYAISPDINGGLPEKLNTNQQPGFVQLSLPFLKYWTTMILEY